MSPRIHWFPDDPEDRAAFETALLVALRAEGVDVDASVQLTAHNDGWDVRLRDNAKDAGIRRRLAERLRAAGFPAVAAPTKNPSNVTLTWSGKRPQDAAFVEEVVLGELARLEDLRPGREWRDLIAGFLYVTFAYETDQLGVELVYSRPGIMGQQALGEDQADDAGRYRARVVEALQAEGFTAS